jgi:hypothetical protein
MLHLARKLVERAGGIVAYWDTDSTAVVAAPDGSLIPCPGGSERDEHGREAIRPLSYTDVLNVQARLEELNPYPAELRPYEHVFLPGGTRPDRLGMPREESGSWTRVPIPGLLELEDENFDGGPSQRRQLHLSADASKSYELYFCELPTVRAPSCEAKQGDGLTDLTLVKASEHGLAHVLDPRNHHDGDKDWIAEGKLYIRRREHGLAAPEPRWLGELALSRLALTHPDELQRLDGVLRGSRRHSALRPWSRIAIALPAPLYARDPTRNGERRTPIAPWHDGFDPTRADWHDYASERHLTIRSSGTELTERDLMHADSVPIQTMHAVLARNQRRTEQKALAADRQPCKPDTAGILRPAPTEASQVLAIGREGGNLERDGIINDPTYITYTNVDDEAWRDLYYPTIRDLLPRAEGGITGAARRSGIPRRTLTRVLSTGSASRPIQARLIPIAAELARDALQVIDPGLQAPSDHELACYLYLRNSGQLAPRLCAGCGTRLVSRQRRWCASCKKSPRTRTQA